MAIIGLQRRIREVGRIRIGVQAATSTGRKAPRKLDRFRFTSTDRSVIEAAAGVFGGTASAWDNGGAQQWEVVTDASEIRILLPPDPSDMAWSQFYETWAKGFCGRRCDGQWDTVRDRACDCDPEDRECKPTSRLSVLLPDIAGLGLWRLESHGYYAAVELAGAIDLIGQMAGAHTMIPARLRLEQREVRRIVKTKPVVHKFVVPVIDLDVSIMGVRALAMRVGNVEIEGPDDQVPELPEGWKPVPDPEVPPVLSLVEQVKEAEKPTPAKPRKNAAAPLPATGRTRTGATPDNTCSVCGKGYGSESLTKNPGEGSRFVHRSCLNDEATPTETSAVADEPPHEGAGSGGGKANGAPSAEPSPAAARARNRMTHGQHNKVFAMIEKLFPDGDDDHRRAVTLNLCEVLGTPGLTSRTEIDGQTAMVLIDALEAIEAGQFVYENDRLVDKETGAIIDLREATP
jgi:hypothetical protein